MNKRGINFNRPALVAAMQAARRRALRTAFATSYVVLLALVASYLGVHAILMQRTLRVTRGTLGGAQLDDSAREVLQLDGGYLDLMRQVSEADKCWAPKLERLALLLPEDAWIVRLDAGTSGATLTDEKRRRLTMNVSAAVHNEEDKILFPMRFVRALQEDRSFSAGYRDIRFSTTRVLEGSQAVVVNFEVECR